ncbi:hypothetical protein KFZ58_14345 [Virgibacillus sp. NKC19-16]|uniref:hypothetical protein n=1 Tax=Virgibacillus salidurans TaxID=2831673 RepID=UPI001F359CC3|nr:hypothetical protein [Virgibacillus sp. NKC19-16]UJL45568.1 hypothetical protein KFZ58_14345 [Virgibacillus sp. NKC19-16]
MNALIQWGLRLSITFYALLHFITYFYDKEILLFFLSISGLSLFLFAVISYTVKNIKLPLSLFLVGIAILFFSNGSMTEGILNGFLQMRDMIGLLVVIPMIGWVLREEPYMEAIMGFGHKMLNTSRKFYVGMASFTQIIAYFLNFGSIPMMYQFENMILKDEKGEAWENFKGTAVLRGFALSTMWVVSIPSFAFVVEAMNASLWVSIFQGLGMSICGIFLAVAFSHFEEKRYGVDLTTGLQTEISEVLRHTTDRKQRNHRVREFVVLFVTLFGTIFLLQAVLPIELLVLIPLVVLVWIGVYYLVKKRTKNLLKEAKIYVQTDMGKQSYQLCVMLGAGMMISALNQTGFASLVVDGIYALQESLPFINVLYFLPFMVIILAFFGLGPLTVMVLVGGILGSLSLPYPPELIVLVVTSGSAISILLSPMIMPVIVLSGNNGLSLFTNGVKFNWKYAAMLYVVVQVYVQGVVGVW